MTNDNVTSRLYLRDLDPDPFQQFARWFAAAEAASAQSRRQDGAAAFPNAMTLATATSDGMPSARMVLLKGFDDQGFVFYTNYDGRKANELEANPHAALLLYWPELGRQIRMEGEVVRTTLTESETYFNSRPRGSQLAALASAQSRIIENRVTLEKRMAELEEEFSGRDVPLPPFWGGYRLKPASFEFWQHQPDRLHDRLLYLRAPNGTWRIDRLAP